MQVIESADCAGTVDDAVIVDSSPARTLVASWLVAADGCRPADPATGPRCWTTTQPPSCCGMSDNR